MPSDFDITISESGKMVNEPLENNIECFNGNPKEDMPSHYEDFCNPNNLANSDFCSRSEIHSASTSNISNDFYAANRRDDDCEEMINELLSDNIWCIDFRMGTDEVDRIEEYINELFNTDTSVIVSFISFSFFYNFF